MDLGLLCGSGGGGVDAVLKYHSKGDSGGSRISEMGQGRQPQSLC